ncbi:MFS transporter [Nocardioides sp.]|uniref:MFS transporter n=1 Tax=Nocardioides sp. TaxID=35761 RepID=UPI002F4077FF
MVWGSRLRALRMDVGPFREHRDFRLLLIAGTVFYLGGMMTYVAIPYQIYQLTHSNFAVGAVGLVELGPLIVFGLYGGALADHVDRRLLLIWTGIAQAAFTTWLCINAFSDNPRLWEIFVVAGLLTSSSALQRPSREALLPRTVRHDELTAANALSSFGMQGGVLVGPTIGGLIVASAGVEWCFLVDIIGLFVASMMYAAMRRYPHVGETEVPSLAGIGRGLRYALSRRDLLGTYLVDFAAMLLAMPVVLFPALAEKVFGDPHLLGLLYSAETIGALVATASSGWTSRVHHHGRAIVLAAAAYGGCIALAGFSTSIWMAVFFFALAGAADMISAVFRGTIWSQTIPDTLRGRLAGIEMLSYSVGPLAGQVRAGVVADRWTVRGSIISGGLSCVAGVTLTAVWLHDFWAYDERTDEHALAQKEARQLAGERSQP